MITAGERPGIPAQPVAYGDSMGRTDRGRRATRLRSDWLWGHEHPYWIRGVQIKANNRTETVRWSAAWMRLALCHAPVGWGRGVQP